MESSILGNHDHTPTREVWEFEKFLASEPDVWRNEAINLRYSAEALWLYDEEVTHRVFNDRTNLRLPCFWSARVERMLMGFSLENLVKAILLQDKEKFSQVFCREGKLSWGRHGHDLIRLFGDAKIEIDKLESTYLDAWQTCALWAGRYPLPINEKDLPSQRKPMASPEGLSKRTRRRHQKAMEEGDQLLGAETHDIIHGSVGGMERDVYKTIFDRCLLMLPKR